MSKPCVTCGRDVTNESDGVMLVHADERIEYFCAEHNPNPPTPEELADRERQELEGAAAAVRAEETLIRGLIDLDHPVTAVDRANIGMLLLRMQQRWLSLYNEVQEMQGKSPIPFAPAPFARPREPDGLEVSGATAVPNYRIVVDHLWSPSIDEQVYHGSDVRFTEVVQAVTDAGGTWSGGSPGEEQSFVTFHAPNDDVVEHVRRRLDVPGRHRVHAVQYLPEFPQGAPLVIWRREAGSEGDATDTPKDGDPANPC